MSVLCSECIGLLMLTVGLDVCWPTIANGKKHVVYILVLQEVLNY